MQTGIKSASVLFPCPAPAHPGTAKKRIGKTRITKKSISVLHRYSRIDSIFFITKIISAHLSGVNLEHGNEKWLASGTWKRKMAGIWNMETKNGWHPEHGNEKWLASGTWKRKTAGIRNMETKNFNGKMKKPQQKKRSPVKKKRGCALPSVIDPVFQR